MIFPESIRWIRGCIIDYASGTKKEATLEFVLEAAMRAISSKHLTKEEVLKVIDKIEEDPLCLIYISREERTRKLKPLKDLLVDMER